MLGEAGAVSQRGNADRAARGLDGRTPEHVGRYRYDVVTDTWWWSDEIFAMHGLDPGGVVPTTDLLLAHKHPDHVTEAEQLLRRTFEDGTPFCAHHRILDATDRGRDVLVTGQGVPGGSGRPVEVRGFMVDLTGSARRYSDTDLRNAITAATEHRAVIDQAKGALMLTYGVSAEDAFARLSQHSQKGNVKLRDLARRVVEEIQAGAPGPRVGAARIEALLREVTRTPE
jgi:hypothetical protein